MMKDLKNYSLKELRTLICDSGGKAYMADYIFRFIHQKNINEIDEITTISKNLRTALKEQGFFISSLKPVKEYKDADGTKKYLFELSDSNRIETVILHDGKRITLCISTQAGCNMGCVFCATARKKLVRNLSAAEIIDQLYYVNSQRQSVTNIVYMGMGEPLDNYKNSIKSLQILTCSEGKNIAQKHITISTCGIADMIEELADERVKPRLAVSLNAPTEKGRKKLMPVTKHYSLKRLEKSILYFQRRTRQRVTFEYILLKGINDSTEDARRTAALLKRFRCNVNLIEYNPHPQCRFKSSAQAVVKNFSHILEDSGLTVTVRKKKGSSIRAACGQLGSAN